VISAKIPRIACVVAFLMAGGVVILALTGPIAVLPFALIPLFAGIGIMRRRAWSAYGFALYSLAQLLPFALVLIRAASPATQLLDLMTSAVWTVLIGGLFFLAGKSLANAGAARGRAFPWIVVSALVTLPFFFVQAFVIPTGAMEETLLIGDRILVQHFPRPRPARGDMVVFVYPIDRRQTFVKRVVGVPGDRIRISLKVVYRNGTKLNEPYAVHKTDYQDLYRDNFPSEPNVQLAAPGQEMLTKHVVNGEVVVPEGKYFVLGDNRDSSLDSRYWGFVSRGDLIGRPLLIYDSADQPTEDVLKGKSFGKRRLRWNRIFKLI
jgi:signal peptidase I